jgi:hypothetical protein
MNKILLSCRRCCVPGTDAPNDGLSFPGWGRFFKNRRTGMKEAANQGALQREGHKDEYRDQRGDGNSNKGEEKFVHYEPTPNWLVRSARH